MKLIRIIRWSAIILLLVSAFLVIARPLPARYLVVTSDTQQALFALFAAITTIVAGFRLSVDNPFRRIWLLTGFGLLLWSGGDFCWWLLEAVIGIAPFPSVADVFWSLGYIPLFAGLVYAYRKLGARPTAISIVVSAILVGILLIDSFVFLFIPVLAGKIGVIEKVLDLGYPIGDAVLMVPIIFTLLTTRFKTTSGLWKWMLLGLTLRIVADSLFSYMTFNNSFSSGGYLDVLWMSGYFVFWMTSLSQIERDLRERSGAFFPTD